MTPARPRMFSMKSITLVCALFALLWISLRAQAQEQSQPAQQEDYQYLRRLHVPDTVVDCVAALDRWVQQTTRYDSVLVPDRRLLDARIERPDDNFDEEASSTPVPASSSASPLDSQISMRGFAKVRGKYTWVPVKATCSLDHAQIVNVALQPRGVRDTQ